MNEEKPGLPAHSEAIGNKERTNQARHTPGPWHVGGAGSASARGMARVWGPDRAAVCAISERRTLGVEETPEMDANALLIAAAPALAEALARLLRANTEEPGDIRGSMKVARAALRAAGRLA